MKTAEVALFWSVCVCMCAFASLCFKRSANSIIFPKPTITPTSCSHTHEAQPVQQLEHPRGELVRWVWHREHHLLHLIQTSSFQVHWDLFRPSHTTTRHSVRIAHVGVETKTWDRSSVRAALWACFHVFLSCAVSFLLAFWFQECTPTQLELLNGKISYLACSLTGW